MQRDSVEIHPVPPDKDEDKSKEELIKELDQLRDYSKKLQNLLDPSSSISGENARIVEFSQPDLRKKCEELLQQSEGKTRPPDQTGTGIGGLSLADDIRTRLASIVELSEDAIISKNLDGIILSWNKGAENIYGYTAEEMIGKNVSILVPPNLKDEMPNLMHRIRKGLRIEHYETERVRRDGRTINISLSVSPIVDRSNHVIGASTIARDITERKQNEKNLKKSRAILSRAQDLAHVGNWAWDLKSNTMNWSDEIYRIFRLPPQSFQPSYDWLASHIHPGDLNTIKESFALAIRENKLFNIDTRILVKDGSVRYINLIADRIKKDPQGHPEWMYGIVQDITGRKRAEEALQLTQFAVDNFTDSSIWIDPAGKITYVNAITCQGLGYAKEELLSMHVWDIDPDYSPPKFARIWEEIKQKGSVVFDSYHRKKDGGKFPVEVSAKYMKFDDIEIMVSFDRDITLRMRAEEELVEAKSQAELYLDLMGHDINNLNQIALGYLELASDTLETSEEGEQTRELISRPIDAIHSSTRLIENVRTLQKIKTGNLMVETIDLDTILSQLRDQYLKIGNVRISYRQTPCCLIKANGLITDVFSNLIWNAIKHKANAEPVEIGISLDRVTDSGRVFYRVAVEDNGPGIPDELKKRVFTRYQRGNTSAHGTGLGLYLVRKLVDYFHGRVWAEDRVPGDPAKGSRFIVLLPASGD